MPRVLFPPYFFKRPSLLLMATVVATTRRMKNKSERMAKKMCSHLLCLVAKAIFAIWPLEAVACDFTLLGQLLLAATFQNSKFTSYASLLFDCHLIELLKAVNDSVVYETNQVYRFKAYPYCLRYPFWHIRCSFWIKQLQLFHFRFRRVKKLYAWSVSQKRCHTFQLPQRHIHCTNSA